MRGTRMFRRMIGRHIEAKLIRTAGRYLQQHIVCRLFRRNMQAVRVQIRRVKAVRLIRFVRVGDFRRKVILQANLQCRPGTDADDRSEQAAVVGPMTECATLQALDHFTYIQSQPRPV
ncbi:MAG: hypothetical protein U0992_08210 [Planctomycetaceae bacterium]